MLHALYEREILADLLVGTSAGAINAAFIASRPQTVDTALELAEVWCSLRRRDVFPLHVRAVIGGLRGTRDHLVPDSGLRELVRRHVELELLEDAPIPLHVVCFDVAAQREVVLSTGRAWDAVVASSSIPGILPPVRIAGRHLIDGGFVKTSPISHAVSLGARRIYVLPTSDGSQPPAAGGALDAALTGLRLLIQRRLDAELDQLSRDVELTVLPAVNTSHVSPSDFDHARSLIDGALTAAREVLAHRNGELAA
jgi:NTE family protein